MAAVRRPRELRQPRAAAAASVARARASSVSSVVERRGDRGRVAATRSARRRRRPRARPACRAATDGTPCAIASSGVIAEAFVVGQEREHARAPVEPRRARRRSTYSRQSTRSATPSAGGERARIDARSASGCRRRAPAARRARRARRARMPAIRSGMRRRLNSEPTYSTSGARGRRGRAIARPARPAARAMQSRRVGTPRQRTISSAENSRSSRPRARGAPAAGSATGAAAFAPAEPLRMREERHVVDRDDERAGQRAAARCRPARRTRRRRAASAARGRRDLFPPRAGALGRLRPRQRTRGPSAAARGGGVGRHERREAVRRIADRRPTTRRTSSR